MIGVAVSAVFYHILGTARYAKKLSNLLAAIHLILMSVGIAVATGLMMCAGYIGGAAALPKSTGGQGFNPGQVHELIGGFVEPIAILFVIIGVIAGGIGFVIAYRRQSPASQTS